MKIFFNETIEFDERNVIKFNHIRDGVEIDCYLYYYKVIRIIVINPMKFLDTRDYIII